MKASDWMAQQPQRTNVQDYAFTIGEIAQAAGLTDAECPYIVGDPLRDWWLNGYRHSMHMAEVFSRRGPELT